MVAGLCDQVMVLYGGRIMEQGSADDIFYHPTHPYTLGLLGAVPKLDHEGEKLVGQGTHKRAIDPAPTE